MNITQDDILNDIADYEQRITAVKAKLSLLSTGYLPYLEHKKREKKKNDLLDDIKHLESLIKIARSAITGEG